MGSQGQCLRARGLPLIIQSSECAPIRDPLELISLLKARIRKELISAGAVVLRGFGVRGAHHFKDLVENFSNCDLLNYAGGASPRSAIADGIYTSTEYPPEMPLALHNELSYSAIYPRTLFFFCA